MATVRESVPKVTSPMHVHKHAQQEPQVAAFSGRTVSRDKSTGIRPHKTVPLHESVLSKPKALHERGGVAVVQSTRTHHDQPAPAQLQEQQIRIREQTVSTTLVQVDQNAEGSRGSPAPNPNQKKFRDELFRTASENSSNRGKAEDMLQSLKCAVGMGKITIELDPNAAATKILKKLEKKTLDPSSFLRATYQSVKLLNSNEFVSDAINQLDLKDIRTLYRQVNTREFVNLHETVALLAQDTSYPMAPTFQKLDQVMNVLVNELQYNMQIAELDTAPYQLANYSGVKTPQDVSPKNALAVRDLQDWVGRFEDRFEELYGDRIREKRFELNRERERSSSASRSSSDSEEW